MRVALLMLGLVSAAAAAEPSFREIFDPSSKSLPTGGSRNRVRQAMFDKRLASKGVAPAIRAMAAWEKHLAALQKRIDKDYATYMKSHAKWWGWRRKWEKASLKRTGRMPAEYPMPPGLNKDFIAKEERFKRTRSLKQRELIFHERVLEACRKQMDDKGIDALAKGLSHKSVYQRLRCARMLRGIDDARVAKAVADARKREKNPGLLAALMEIGDAAVAPFLTHVAWQVRAGALRRVKDKAQLEKALAREKGRLRDDAAVALGKDAGGTPLLAGIKSSSRRIVFCVEPGAEVLAKVVESLPTDVTFSIVLIGPEPAVWRKKLSSERAAAAAWLRKYEAPEGPPDLFAALSRAFAFDADTLVLVTMNGPVREVGRVDNALHIYHELEPRLLLSGIRVHAVGRSGGAKYFYLERFTKAFGGMLVTPPG